jgi:hypothetical protein
VREERRREQVSARLANAAFGARLATELHAPSLTRDAARLLALLVVDRVGADLAARGLRYVREDWQTVERRTLRSGESRERVTFLDRPDCEARLTAWLDAARTPEEVLGRVLQAVLAAAFADETAVARSQRVGGGLPGEHGPRGGEMVELALRLARDLLPPARLARLRPRGGGGPARARAGRRGTRGGGHARRRLSGPPRPG